MHTIKEPIFFNDITSALTSTELLPQDKQIVYFAIGSHNSSGTHHGFGYAQSLPLFLEHLIKNQNIVKNIKIILCDSKWSGDNIEQDFMHSDLAKYLKCADMEAYIDNFYCVTKWIDNKDYQSIAEYSVATLHKGGLIFIGQFAYPQTDLYEHLINVCQNRNINSYHRLYFLNWAVCEAKTLDGKLARVNTILWDGKPLNIIDNTLMEQWAINFYNTVEYLSGNLIKKLEKNSAMRSLLPMVIEEQKKIDSLINTDIDKHWKNLAGELDYHGLLNDGTKIDSRQFDEVKSAFLNFNKLLDCSMVALIPTQHIPVLDFNILMDNQGLIAEVSMPDKYADFKLPHLFTKEVLYDLAGKLPVNVKSTLTSESVGRFFHSPNVKKIDTNILDGEDFEIKGPH